MERTLTKCRQLSRRRVIAGLTATAGLTLSGCGQARARQRADGQMLGANTTAAAASASSRMIVYRDPSCGCCEAWADIARNAGFRVEVIDHPDMAAIKRQYGVPRDLLSCHTTVVGGYAVEGHVPLADVRRLLNEKPAGVSGIGVAGMPLGSPGMEVPDGTTQPFQVMAFDRAGRLSVFAG